MNPDLMHPPVSGATAPDTRIALVAEVGKALISVEDLEVQLGRCVDAVVRHLDAAFARIWTLEGEDVLRLRASAGLYTHIDGAHARVRVGQLKIGQIARERAPLLTNEVVDDPRIGDREWARREGMVAFAGYPLLVQERLVGVLALFARRALTPDTLEALASIADQLALGIDRARTDDRERRLSRQLMHLREASIAVHTAPTLRDTLQQITESVRELIGAHQSVTSFTVGQDWAQSVAIVSLTDKYAAWRPYDVPPDGSGIYAVVCRTNRPMRLTQAQLEAHPAWRAFGAERERHPPMRGWLAAPLVGRDGENLGLLQLSDRFEGDFTEDDEQLLVQFARMASVAIENSRLLEAQRQQAETLARTVQALERSNRELDQFAYVTSHDLKAPLRGIANLVQWIEEDLGGAVTGAARDHIRMLHRRVHRMDALIEGILSFSRAGRAQAPERVDVRRLVQDVVELVAPPATARIDLIGDWPVLETERVALQQVFMNLIGNALKHAARLDPTVRVSAVDRGARWEFSVEDDGPGIAPEFHEKVWGIFQTLQSRDKVEGAGVGLSIVQKIVESRGCRAWLTSSEGAGATFTFSWPKKVGGT